ncbi:unnamed protein product, partial [Didymodactylos carnosus]
ERFNDIQTKLHGLNFNDRYVLNDDKDNYYPFNYVDNYFKYDDTLPLKHQSDVQITENEKSLTNTIELTHKPEVVKQLSVPFTSPRSSVAFAQLPTSNDQVSILDKRHVSVYLNRIENHTEVILPPEQQQQQFDWIHFSFRPPSPLSSISPTSSTMSYMYNSVPRQRNVHWNENNNSLRRLKRSASQYNTNNLNEKNNHTKYSSETTMTGQRISLAASLPFDTRLNIRIQADRSSKSQHQNEKDDDPNRIKATASIESLDPANEHIHFSNVNKYYQQHYSTVDSSSTAEATMHFYHPNRQTHKQQYYGDSDDLYIHKIPKTRKISLPISLPIDKRMRLYIRDGEVLARC